MSLTRIATRVSRAALTQCRSSVLHVNRVDAKQFHSFTNQLISPRGLDEKVVSGQMSLLHHSALNSLGFKWFGSSSSASPEPNEKEAAQSKDDQEKKEEETKSESVSEEKVESDLGKEVELTRDDLVKLVAEKEQLLEDKQEELETMKDKVLRAFAEMENVKDRTRRESENTKKFAIQNFAKSLLDVGDNLGRASTAAKESFSKIEASKDTTGAVQQLKVLLEGVEMTEKQLAEVFKKFGLEKYDPVNEEFDPNRHNAVFQVPDASKPAGHVAVVLKAGYILHDRVIRPAEVGVTVAVESKEA